MVDDPPEIAVSVCLPVYNEPALRRTLLEIITVMSGLPYPFEILVIDDGSTDGGVASIRDLPGIRLIRHRRNLGGGVARLTGIRRARGALIVQTDADGTYPLDRLPAMLARMDQADMVIGARRRESATDWRWLRTVMKQGMQSLAGLMAGHHIPDLNSGLRVYRRETALRYAPLYPPGHSIMSTMTLAFLTDGLRVVFEAVDYRVREGVSSFHPVWDTYNYFLTILRMAVVFNPLRILMPMVVAVGLAALLFSIRNLAVHQGLGSMPLLLWLLDLLLLVLALISDQLGRLSRQILYRDGTFPYDHWVQEEPFADEGPSSEFQAPQILGQTDGT